MANLFTANNEEAKRIGSNPIHPGKPMSKVQAWFWLIVLALMWVVAIAGAIAVIHPVHGGVRIFFIP